MQAARIAAVIALVAMVTLAPVSAQDRDKDAKEVAAAVANFKTDADVAKWFSAAYGYAVFPSITKAAVVVGGAAGNGQVFEKGAYIGDAHVSQATVGAQLGGQSFAEVIFFETKAALDHFKDNKFEWSAGLSAVAAGEGKAKDAKYANGVAIFTHAKKGLMAEASVGGQKFKFTPKK
jgi:lipid-binding SYLF domain-containing protein